MRGIRTPAEILRTLGCGVVGGIVRAAAVLALGPVIGIVVVVVVCIIAGLYVVTTD